MIQYHLEPQYLFVLRHQKLSIYPDYTNHVTPRKVSIVNKQRKTSGIYLRIVLNFFSVHEEINSKMWYTLCNPRSVLRKGVYHICEFISNEPNKKL
jgi:hypothetical protein